MLVDCIRLFWDHFQYFGNTYQHHQKLTNISCLELSLAHFTLTDWLVQSYLPLYNAFIIIPQSFIIVHTDTNN